MVPVFRPDTSVDLFLDGYLIWYVMALFLVLLVANLLWHLFAMGNLVSVALRCLWHIFVVAFLFGYLLVFGNIDVIAILMGDFLTFLCITYN